MIRTLYPGLINGTVVLPTPFHELVIILQLTVSHLVIGRAIPEECEYSRLCYPTFHQVSPWNTI